VNAETLPRVEYGDPPPVAPGKPEWYDAVTDGWLAETQLEADPRTGWQAFVRWAGPSPWYQWPVFWIAYRASRVVRRVRRAAS
jgi:hypothetical protein